MADPFMLGASRFMGDWAAFQARRQLQLQGQCLDAALNPGPQRVARMQRSWCDMVSQALAWPFDLMRMQHATLMQSGVLRPSLLASQRFESRLEALEKLSLGPLARSV